MTPEEFRAARFAVAEKRRTRLADEAIRVERWYVTIYPPLPDREPPLEPGSPLDVFFRGAVALAAADGCLGDRVRVRARTAGHGFPYGTVYGKAAHPQAYTPKPVFLVRLEGWGWVWGEDRHLIPAANFTGTERPDPFGPVPVAVPDVEATLRNLWWPGRRDPPRV